jgi:hypothetical protein
MVRYGRAAPLAMACAAASCSVLTDLDGLSGSTDAPSGDALNDAPFHTIAFVQATYGLYSSSGLLFSKAIADGDAVVVVVQNSVPGAVTVSDANANTYTPAIDQYIETGGGRLSVFATFGAKGGFNTVHVSAPDGGTGYSYYAAEYAGITTLDAVGMGSTQSNGTDALVTNSVMTKADPELLFAFGESEGSVQAGTVFNSRSNFDGNVMEDRIVTAPDSYQGIATLMGPTGDIVLACFH